MDSSELKVICFKKSRKERKIVESIKTYHGRELSAPSEIPLSSLGVHSLDATARTICNQLRKRREASSLPFNACTLAARIAEGGGPQWTSGQLSRAERS